MIDLAGASAVAAREGTACSIQLGTQVRDIRIGDTTRRFWIGAGRRVPAGGAAPIVFLWHGWGSNPLSILRRFDSERLWPDAIVVAPEGVARRIQGLGMSRHRGWQLTTGEFDDRDLHLFDAILETLLGEGCVDSKRVYSAGFSNGGFFSNLLGCRRPDAIAAIASVAGGGPDAPPCGEPVPVLITHGTSDPVVPYGSGKESFRRWRAENGCEGQPARAATSCVEATGCRAPVTFCSFSGGHRWPGGTSRRIVEFLRSQRK